MSYKWILACVECRHLLEDSECHCPRDERGQRMAVQVRLDEDGRLGTTDEDGSLLGGWKEFDEKARADDFHGFWGFSND